MKHGILVPLDLKRMLEYYPKLNTHSLTTAMKWVNFSESTDYCNTKNIKKIIAKSIRQLN